MGLNIKELKRKQKDIAKVARKEIEENIKENILEVVLDDDILNLFHQEMSRNVATQSKRVISHWVKKGLIEGEQSKEGGWYHFSHIETFWIQIITNLRQFGLDLDKIKYIRQQLFTDEVQGFSLFEYIIMYSVLKEPYVLLIFEDGTVQLLTTSLYSNEISKSLLPPHIVINLLDLAEKMYPHNNFHLGQNEGNIADLSNEELKLLYFIRTGDFQEVKIRLNEDDVFLVEGKKQVKNPENIMRLINEKAYQDIEIKTVNGKVAYISATQKIKLK
ncbi:MerR family transcriptional regulator [Flavobacterium sp. CS20]|uniref:MerR family transcriptional regulator n=1 Tax=Flavobacterium sp. CS20 TaxID=2775246 RepID=UPI001B39F118|nr:MerR family transcriptional regulator [Flavobacterium sp. CS20]QTY25962.1 MerR family transcriptional regulator [Flavobacterium sp. CS20]